MKSLSPFRYFWLVSSPRSYLLAVLALLALLGIGTEFVNPGSSDFVLAAILLIQLFAVSTGFVTHASRGFYDPVLVSGRGRLSLALSHLAASALPGWGAWTAVGAAEAVSSGSLHVLAFRTAGWASLLLVSTLPWAATLRLPPLSGGAIWLLISAGVLISGKAMGLFAILKDPSISMSVGLPKGLAFGLAFPLGIPNVRWPVPVLIGFFLVSLLATGAGALLIRFTDFPLVEEG